MLLELVHDVERLILPTRTEGRTAFVIAHLLSTIQNSKAIIVLDKGRIIERGSHDKLIEQRGRYCQLYTGAFESADEMEQETA